jgi:DNA-binding transcriptional MerR regulator
MTEQNKSKILRNEKLLSTSEVLRILNIAKHKLDYLFESRKLKREDFTTLDNGHRIYKEADVNKIRQVLFEVSAK